MLVCFAVTLCKTVCFHSCALTAGKLRTADLSATSKAMQAHNAEVLAGLQDKWQGIFRRMFEGLPPAALQPRHQEQDFDTALKLAYNVSLSNCQGQTDLAQG
jgi:hypothetical protein